MLEYHTKMEIQSNYSRFYHKNILSNIQFISQEVLDKTTKNWYRFEDEIGSILGTNSFCWNYVNSIQKAGPFC